MTKYLLFVLIFAFNSLQAQTCEISNIVFEGAGIRGIAYAGVIEELENRDKLKGIKRVGGTSAGAITALMISLGYSSGEIAEIISSTRFKKFNDGRFIFIGGMIRMNRSFGWYRGEKVSKWIGDIIETKTGDRDITFEELAGGDYKDLYVTGVSLNRQKLLLFSKETYPTMKVKDAVRISMSIPLYFKAVFINEEGDILQKKAREKFSHIVVDGGIIGNFPIAIFDSVRVDGEGKEYRLPDPNTLGVRIDSEAQIKYDSLSKGLAPIEISNLKDFVSGLYVLVIENLNRPDLTTDDWDRTLSVSSEGISPRITRLSKSEKEMLLNSGMKYAAAYFENCDPDK